MAAAPTAGGTTTAERRPLAPLTEQTRVEAREIMARYPRSRSALLPMLHLVQSVQGYVTPQGVALCAEELGLTKAEVGAVATFYTMYKRRPTGDYLVSVCTNTLCGFLGGEEIFAALKDYLEVGHDQTTADGLITLEHAECLAACDYAPVVTINYEFYDQQDTDSTLGLIRDLQAGRRPAPTRGAPLSSFREISRELAGFPDPATVAAAVDGPSALQPTVAGARLAVERGDTAPSYDERTPIAPPPAEDSVARSDAAPQPAANADPAPAAAEGTDGDHPADPEPHAGQTPHKEASDRAEGEADSAAEQAGAAMADPDTNDEVLDPAVTRSEEPATPAAAVAEATGAPVGPGSTQPPQARRTRSRQRPGGSSKMPGDSRKDDPGRPHRPGGAGGPGRDGRS